MPSARRPYRLKYVDALKAHDKALQFGGRPGILSEALIQSAIERPYSGYYRSIQSKAAALAESLCRNHGFVDGNKRTCLLLLDVFLDHSGYYLSPLRGEDINYALEEMVADVAQGVMDFDDIRQWISVRIKRKPRK